LTSFFICIYEVKDRVNINEEKKSKTKEFVFAKNNKTRRIRWVGHVARMGEGSVVYRVLVLKSQGRRPMGRPRRRWEDNVRIDLQEVECGFRTGLSWLRIGTGGGRL
jgi:hypothetical protein